MKLVLKLVVAVAGVWTIFSYGGVNLTTVPIPVTPITIDSGETATIGLSSLAPITVPGAFKRWQIVCSLALIPAQTAKLTTWVLFVRHGPELSKLNVDIGDIDDESAYGATVIDIGPGGQGFVDVLSFSYLQYGKATDLNIINSDTMSGDKITFTQCLAYPNQN